MRRIYYLSTCDTCKRIMRETGTEGFELHDLKTNPIDAETLDFLFERVGSYEALFNKRSRRFSAEGLNKKALSDQAFRPLILEEYTYLKRPVYIIDDEVFVGNSTSNVQDIKMALHV